MNSLTLENAAQSCMPDAFIGLLKEWGDTKFGDAFTGITSGLDIISKAVQSPGFNIVSHAAEKKQLLINYVAKLEPFAPKHELAHDSEEEFRAAIEELTRRLDKAEQEIKKLKEENASKPAKSNPGPKPRQS